MSHRRLPKSACLTASHLEPEESNTPWWCIPCFRAGLHLSHRLFTLLVQPRSLWGCLSLVLLPTCPPLVLESLLVTPLLLPLAFQSSCAGSELPVLVESADSSPPELTSWQQLQLAAVSGYSADMWPPFCLNYEFHRFPIVAYCSFNSYFTVNEQLNAF